MKISIYPHQLSSLFEYVDFSYKAVPGSFINSVFHEHWRHLSQSAELISDETIVLDLAHSSTGNILYTADITASLIEGGVKNPILPYSGRYEPLTNFLCKIFNGNHGNIAPHRFYLDKSYRAECIEKHLTQSEGTNYADVIEQVDRLIHDVNRHFGAVDSAIDRNYPFREPETPGLFLSPEPILNAAYIESQRIISPDNVIAILAISGINVVLPSVFCEEEGDLEMLKEICAEERRDYLDELTSMILKCCDGLRAGEYCDAWEFAKEVTDQKIQKHVRSLEQAVMKGDKNFLKRVKVGLEEGIPTICTAHLNPPKSLLAAAKSGLATTGADFLKVFCTSMTDKSALKPAEGNYSLASYAYYLRNQSKQLYEYISQYNEFEERHKTIRSKEKTSTFEVSYNAYVELMAEVNMAELYLSIYGEGSGQLAIPMGEEELNPSALALQYDSLRENVCRDIINLCISNNRLGESFEQLSYLKGRRLAANEGKKSLQFGGYSQEFDIDVMMLGAADRPHFRETEKGGGIALIEFYYQKHAESIFAIISIAHGGVATEEKQFKLFSDTDTKRLYETLVSMFKQEDAIGLNSCVETMLGIMVKGFGSTIDFLEMQKVEKIVLVPHLFLHCLPWHACHSLNDNRTLMERFSIVTYANNALIYEASMNNRSSGNRKYMVGSSFDAAGLSSGWSGSLLSMSMSGMYKSISDKYEGRIFINPSREEVLHILQNSAIFVFEGHAQSSLSNYELSELICRDGGITFKDITSLGCPVPIFLAILNACQTGLTSNVNEIRDEYYGLDGALIAGGAQSVISTLWPVSDQASFLVSAKIQFDLLNGFGREQPGILLPQCVNWLRTGQWKDTWPGIRQHLELDYSDIPSLYGIVDEEALDKNEAFIRSIDSLTADAFKEPFYWAGWKNTGWGGRIGGTP